MVNGEWSRAAESEKPKAESGKPSLYLLFALGFGLSTVFLSSLSHYHINLFLPSQYNLFIHDLGHFFIEILYVIVFISGEHTAGG
jgi:hypothetical protein